MTCNSEELSALDGGSDPKPKEFSKIGGILWFPAFRLVAGLIMYVISIINTTSIIDVIRQNTPQLSTLIIYELVAQIALALLTLYTVVLFFRRNKKTPVAYIVLLLLILAYPLAGNNVRWKRTTDYNRRSIAETAMYRVKQVVRRLSDIT